MREYRLADTDYRITVDLTEYEDLIKKVVNDEAPEVEVTVLENRYVLNNPISRGQAIRIGRRLAKSTLGEYCILRPILFVGQDTIDNQSKGGHKSNGNSPAPILRLSASASGMTELQRGKKLHFLPHRRKKTGRQHTKR